jgi:hypothetical protein
MALTDEEKRRIEEEERFRAAARAKAEKANGGTGSGGCLEFIVYAFMFFFLMIVGLVCIGSFFQQPKTAEQLAQEQAAREEEFCNSDNVGAFVMARDAVKKILKSPSTAEFPSGTLDSTIRNTGDCTYEVVSYVDAQNSFGAKLRTKYLAVVRYDGNYQWTTKKVQFLK